jgi:hypothetical protein
MNERMVMVEYGEEWANEERLAWKKEDRKEEERELEEEERELEEK